MFKINWQEFLEQNEFAKKNVGKVSKMRIENFTNEGRTCYLKNLENNNSACMDIAHIVASVRNGSICLTNPSVLKRKIGC